MKTIAIQRTRHRLIPDARRVLARPYLPGDETLIPGPARAHGLMARILAIPEAEVEAMEADVLRRFEARHADFLAMLEQQFEAVAHHIPNTHHVSAARKVLIGAYFTHEYAIEAAALFNPSIVIAPDQAGAAEGCLRVVLSLRAVGEGHLSSIEFRTGELDASGALVIDEVSTRVTSGRRSSPPYFERDRFASKLLELGQANEFSALILAQLNERFTHVELESALTELDEQGRKHALWFEAVRAIRSLALSNYITRFAATSKLSERVLFPSAPFESHGMEDARFVRFTDEDGSVTYYATYTAYDGHRVMPQLIETTDFVDFSIHTLSGAGAQNKGMALLPRKIDGKYVMLSRKDRENLHVTTSTDLYQWNDVSELYCPQHPWELVQVGNCGSPIETAEGWLVLTHGVGPVRRYALGALLLDRDDPTHVIGSLTRPLIEPDESERDGYVPNVLYTCGAIVHAGKLIVPYGFSDAGVAVAQLELAALLQALLDK